MSLICTNGNIRTEEWVNALIKLDQDIKQYDNNRDQFIIVSSPFAINKLRKSMQEFICDTFSDESLFFCCDIILEFMLWTKLNLNNHLKMHKKLSNPYNKWDNIVKTKYDQLLSTQAIIIFNIKNCDYFCIQREINTNSHPFDPIYFYYDKTYQKESELHELIANKIANQLPHHFIVSPDWSKRTDFTETRLVGYLCDNGEVVQGDCLRQQNDKIFIHFNTDAPHFGKKYEWMKVPNERICPPPKVRPKALVQQPETTTYIPTGNYTARSRSRATDTFGLFGSDFDIYGGRGTRTSTNNQTSVLGAGYYDYETMDDDLQRAIAASLQDVGSNIETPTTTHAQPQTENVSDGDEEEEEIDFFEQAVNASRLF